MLDFLVRDNGWRMPNWGLDFGSEVKSSSMLGGHLLEIGAGFIFLFLVDWVLKRFRIRNTTHDSESLRWFILHVISNTIVVLVALPDVLSLLRYPLHLSAHVSTIPKNMTFALHLYHCLMFRNLQLIDWIHHIVMCLLIILIRDNSGAELVNFLLFFLSGFPGGVDYVMLILVKLNWMDSIKEKQINAQINTWIRGPGILIGAVLIYIHYHLGTIEADPTHLTYCLLTLYWNAQYFSNRVITNYGMKLSNPSYEM